MCNIVCIYFGICVCKTELERKKLHNVHNFNGIYKDVIKNDTCNKRNYYAKQNET